MPHFPLVVCCLACSFFFVCFWELIEGEVFNIWGVSSNTRCSLKAQMRWWQWLRDLKVNILAKAFLGKTWWLDIFPSWCGCCFTYCSPYIALSFSSLRECINKTLNSATTLFRQAFLCRGTRVASPLKSCRRITAVRPTHCWKRLMETCITAQGRLVWLMQQGKSGQKRLMTNEVLQLASGRTFDANTVLLVCLLRFKGVSWWSMSWQHIKLMWYVPL